MIEWFSTQWSASDTFKFGVLAVGAVVLSLAVSNQRSAILRPITGLIHDIAVGIRKLLGKTSAPQPAKTVAHTVQTPVAKTSLGQKRQTRLQQQSLEEASKARDRWRQDLQIGCVVSFVEYAGDGEYAIHRGVIQQLDNDIALVWWDVEASDHPFEPCPGPDRAEVSAHDAELIMKEHKLGDRGVTLDVTGVVLVTTGWSIMHWPPAPAL